MKRKGIKKKCVVCGKEFTTYPNVRKIVCSLKCYKIRKCKNESKTNKKLS